MTHDDITKMIGFVRRIAEMNHSSWGTADRDVEREFDEIVDEARKLVRNNGPQGSAAFSDDAGRSLQ